jgi:predicted AAA+ superfamily ATPase
MKTIQSWVGVLESSFIIYLLKPHHNNFNKTIVKRPKLYFYDTSIVCSLVGIRNAAQLKNHPLRGAIFEGMVITELLKNRTNAGMQVNLSFWRDKTGREIDIIVDNGNTQFPIEIKSGKTIHDEFLKNIEYWKSMTGFKKGLVLYAGKENQKRSKGTDILNWRELANLEL